MHVKNLLSPSTILTAGRSLLDLVLPPRCLACGEEMQENGQACATCWSKIRFVAEPCCNICGKPRQSQRSTDDRGMRPDPFSNDFGPSECDHCTGRTLPFDRLRSAIIYDDASKHMILGLKHREKLEGVNLFAQWMMTAGKSLIERTDLILPVPVHRMKLIRRGFNQTAVIGQRIAQLSGKPIHVDALLKTRATRPQVGLSAEDRLSNVTDDHFVVPGSKRPLINDRRLLLIDDVYTTGATTAACCAVLKNAGASGIDILTLARVVNTDHEPIYH